jgi:exosome complex component RRP41
MTYTKRFDGRKAEEIRPIKAEIGVVPNADGSALFAFGETIAIAAVYGPKPMHPQHMQDPKKGVLRCTYDMLSFSVPERKRPGPNRRSQEISKVIEWALAPVLHLEDFPNTVVDVHILITQANASTRCAGINAASLALAHAGLNMDSLVASVSVGKMDTALVTDVIKEEEDYEEGEGATDIAMSFVANTGQLGLIQMDGHISGDELKKAVEMGKIACEKIAEIQNKVLKERKKYSEK